MSPRFDDIPHWLRPLAQSKLKLVFKKLPKEPVMFTRSLFCLPILLLRVLAVLFVLFYLLNAEPARCQTPTRFIVVTMGTPKGPAIPLLPSLFSTRYVLDVEAAILAPDISK